MIQEEFIALHIDVTGRASFRDPFLLRADSVIR